MTMSDKQQHNIPGLHLDEKSEGSSSKKKKNKKRSRNKNKNKGKGKQSEAVKSVATESDEFESADEGDDGTTETSKQPVSSGEVAEDNFEDAHQTPAVVTTEEKEAEQKTPCAMQTSECDSSDTTAAAAYVCHLSVTPIQPDPFHEDMDQDDSPAKTESAPNDSLHGISEAYSSAPQNDLEDDDGTELMEDQQQQQQSNNTEVAASRTATDASTNAAGQSKEVAA